MSVSSQATQQKFPFGYEAVFDSLLGAVQSAGMTVKTEDKLIGRVTASAGMSLFSWGENVTIVVESLSENSTLVAIDSALKMGANLTGSHRHQKNFNKIISEMSSQLKDKES